MFDAKAPTEEEMEAWRMKRRRGDDPMSQFSWTDLTIFYQNLGMKIIQGS